MGAWSQRGSRERPTIETRIEQALDAIRPVLGHDTLKIRLVAFDRATGIASLSFQGDCPDCELSASVLRQGVEANLCQQVPEIREVRAV